MSRQATSIPRCYRASNRTTMATHHHHGRQASYINYEYLLNTRPRNWNTTFFSVQKSVKLKWNKNYQIFPESIHDFTNWDVAYPNSFARFVLFETISCSACKGRLERAGVATDTGEKILGVRRTPLTSAAVALPHLSPPATGRSRKKATAFDRLQWLLWEIFTYIYLGSLSIHRDERCSFTLYYRLNRANFINR